MGLSQAQKLSLPYFGLNNYQMQIPAFNFNATNNQTPLFNFSPDFNNFAYWGNWGGTSATSASSPEAIAAKEAREEENRRKKEEKIDELNKKIEQCSEEKEKVAVFKNDVRNKGGKENKKTGAVEKKASLKSMGFWQKLGRGLKNAVKGMGNLVKPLLGYDKNGKFHLGKCIRNLVCAVGTAVLICCPATTGAGIALLTGGMVSAASAATAVAAVGTAATVAGLAIGTGKVVKGFIDTAKACKSGNIEDFDKATQNIGEGTLLAITSGKGLKQIKTSFGPNFTMPKNLTLKGAPANIKKVALNVKNEGITSTFGKIGNGVKTGVKSIHTQIGNEANSANFYMRTEGLLSGTRTYKASLARQNYIKMRKNYENNLIDKMSKLQSEALRTNNSSKFDRLVAEYNEAAAKLNRLRGIETKDDWAAVMSAKDKPLLQRFKYKRSVKDLKPLQKAADNAAFKASKSSHPSLKKFANDFGYDDKSAWYQRFFSSISHKWKNTSKTEKAMIIGGAALGAPEGMAGVTTMTVGYPLSMSSSCAPLQAGMMLDNPHYELEDVREQMYSQLVTNEDGTIDTLRVVNADEVPAPVQDEKGNQTIPDGYMAITTDTLAQLDDVTQRYDEQIEALRRERDALFNT